MVPTDFNSNSKLNIDIVDILGDIIDNAIAINIDNPIDINPINIAIGINIVRP